MSRTWLFKKNSSRGRRRRGAAAAPHARSFAHSLFSSFPSVTLSTRTVHIALRVTPDHDTALSLRRTVVQFANDIQICWVVDIACSEGGYCSKPYRLHVVTRYPQINLNVGRSGGSGGGNTARKRRPSPMFAVFIYLPSF